MKGRAFMFVIFRQVVRFLWGKGLTKVPLVYRTYRSLYVRLRPSDVTAIEVEGSRIFVEPPRPTMAAYSCTAQLICGTFDRGTTEVFKREVKPGSTAVDVGANIGYYTLLAARLVGESGKVFAFEPAPSNYDLLIKSIAANGYGNVVPVQKAVSARAGQTRLFLDAHDSGAHNLYESCGETVEFSMVDLVSLDEYFEGYGSPVDFIKMDIEGAEVEALQGMTGLIQRNHGLKVVAEFCPRWLRRAGYSAEDFLNCLAGHGFRFLEISENSGTLVPRDVPSLLQAYAGTDGKTNLLCVR